VSHITYRSGIYIIIGKKSYSSPELWLTFADIFPPDVVESTLSTAVYSLSLILSNDDIGESRSRLEDENSCGFILFGLSSTGSTYYFEVIGREN
jgi:hypothetical protein